MIVVGNGRIGGVFAAAGATVVTRTGPHAPLRMPHPGEPIVVCTRNDDLEAVIQATHEENRVDLCFVQNGMLRPLLMAYDLHGCTQGLLYFAVRAPGAAPEPGGESVFWGPHATEIVQLLTGRGVAANTLPDHDALSREIAVKLAWTLVMGLLGDAHRQPVGELARARRGEVEALVVEVAPVLARALDTTLPPRALIDRVLRYSLSIPSWRAGLKELPWRNGWLVGAARELGLAIPRHDALMRSLGLAEVDALYG